MKYLIALKKQVPVLASVLSGIFLFLSFAPFEMGFFGWLALVPLWLACNRASPRRAAFLGWLSGAVFFLFSLGWIHHVTWLGMIALAFYCALYFVPVTLFISFRRAGWGGMKVLRNLLWMSGCAMVWAAAEYLRATLITGFPWNLLGVSQHTQLPLIQMAEWGGVYVISALMVFVNGATAVTLLQYRAGFRTRGYKVHAELMVALLLTAAAWSFGMRIMLMDQPADEPVHVALIQPNIPEVGNWELADPEVIYEALETLSGYALRAPDLDLMIWPETALPDFVRFSPRSAALVTRLTAQGVPLLTGSMDAEWSSDGNHTFYNASMLFDTNGDLLDSYNKQHLVIFGEYIPFEEKIPLINALTPINSSFTPGREPALLSLPGVPGSFSVLICFEDTMPQLARRAALAGARWLVNQTNDSWFDPDCGSRQHMAHSVFRSVETRLPMLRCANTGVTCLIDAKGRVHQTLNPRTSGFQVAGICPAPESRGMTFYTRYGDLFAQSCLIGSLAVFIAVFIQRRRENHA